MLLQRCVAPGRRSTMGIDGFNKFMRESFPASFTSILRGQSIPTRCHRLYIDCNDLLHQAARRARDETQLFKELFVLLDTIIHICRPSKSVFLTLDGPGPYAKILEQRKRRADTGRKAAAQRKKHKHRSSPASDGVLRGSDLKQALTPGTELMHRLQSSLLYWAEAKLSNALRNPRSRSNSHGPVDAHALKFYVSGSNVPGEGEMKILAELYHHAAAEDGTSEQHVIVGGDADLLVMAIQADVPHLSVLQPDQVTRGWQLFSTDAWAHAVAAHISSSSRGRDVLSEVRQDFAALALFEGNDYLPLLPGE